MQMDGSLKGMIHFNSLAEHYEGFILDVWGVIHNGFKAYPEVVESINHLIELKKPIIFMSNAPRPGSVTIKKLLELGIQAKPSMILTSGDIVREELKPKQRFYHLGAERNQDLLAGIPVSVVDTLIDADFLLLTAYLDEGEDLNQYDDLLKQGVSLNIPAICANPDKIVINGNQNRYCSGIFAEKYERMGGKVYYYGKPYAKIYERALKQFKEQGINDKHQIIMIGDTLDTDILGANIAGIDSGLVLTGNMETLLSEKNEIKVRSKAEVLQRIFEEYEIAPTWVIT